MLAIAVTAHRWPGTGVVQRYTTSHVAATATAGVIDPGSALVSRAAPGVHRWCHFPGLSLENGGTAAVVPVTFEDEARSHVLPRKDVDMSIVVEINTWVRRLESDAKVQGTVAFNEPTFPGWPHPEGAAFDLAWSFLWPSSGTENWPSYTGHHRRFASRTPRNVLPLEGPERGGPRMKKRDLASL